MTDLGKVCCNCRRWERLYRIHGKCEILKHEDMSEEDAQYYFFSSDDEVSTRYDYSCPMWDSGGLYD